MNPGTGREPPTNTNDKPVPAPAVDDGEDEDDGDIATPKHDRDYEAEAFEKRDSEKK